MMKTNIRQAVDGVLNYLNNMPKGTEKSTKEALDDLAYFDLPEEYYEVIDRQVRLLAGNYGLILEDVSYKQNQNADDAYNDLYCLRAKDGKLLGIEKIDITQWLKNTYGEDLNPAIVSVEFCQSRDEVWLNVEYGYDSEFGLIHRGESMYLDCAQEPYEQPLDIVPEGKNPYFEETFSPDNDIEENVRRLVTCRETLENVTPLLDK